ncbi:hypothetical protein HZS_5343, partial [Henneguya salminicola]
MKNYNEYFLLVMLSSLLYSSVNEVEVSSDAAAAIKLQHDGQKQTFISSQSKAKAGKDSNNDRSGEPGIGQRSTSFETGHAESNNDLSWAYTDTFKTYSAAKWENYYPICNGSNQSPIPLQTESSKFSNKSVDSLKFNSTYPEGMIHGILINDGHSFGLQVDETRTALRLTGGPLLNQSYQLHQFHFHFSCDNKGTGSEHNAVDKPDGLTVMAFFIKSANEINRGVFFINRYLIDIFTPGSSISIPHGLSIYDLLKKFRDGFENLSYVYYKGSLTTPPCYESVTWIVFQDPIKIPLRDVSIIESWRKLTGSMGLDLCNNFRPLQSLNGR